MGVTGLWQILESVGHPVKIDGLEGKRLGVDANVWLYKFIRGFREKDSVSSLEGHKLGLFNRISKLLFYRIKPVFVFDGPAPALKRRTLEKRQNVRSKHLMKVQDAAMKLLAEQLKEKYPGTNIDHIMINLPELRTNNLVAAEKFTDEDRDLFYIPPEVHTIEDQCESSDSDEFICNVEPKIQVKKDKTALGSAQFDVFQDMSQSVDIHSKEFESLPPEVRYEILVDIRESRRKIRRSHDLPEEASSFSSFQMDRLRSRRIIQEKIEQCEREICSMYTGECDGQTVKSYRVQSDSTSTMLYLNNAKTEKPIATTKVEPEKTCDKDSKLQFQNKESKLELKQPVATIRQLLSRTSAEFLPSVDTVAILSDSSDSDESICNARPKIEEEKEEIVIDLTSPNIIQDKNQSNTHTSDIAFDEQVLQNEAPLQVACCTKIINPNSESAKIDPTVTMVQIKEKPDVTYSDIDESEEELEVLVEGIQPPKDMSVNKYSCSDSYHIPTQHNHNYSSATTSSSSYSESNKEIQNKNSTSPSDHDLNVKTVGSESDLPDDSNETTQELTGTSKTNTTPTTSTPSSLINSASTTPNVSTTTSTTLTTSSNDSTNPTSSVDVVTATSSLQIEKKSPSTMSQPDKATIISDDESVQEISFRPETRTEEFTEVLSTSNIKLNDLSTASAQCVSSSINLDTESTWPTIDPVPESTVSHTLPPPARASLRVTSKIIEEAKELLRLFGIPYIDAAGEAEAQCALLEELNLTEGTITDDSDVWLFGAKNIYRYFFNDDKYVMHYKMTDIEYHVRMTRANLICLAMLVGSDYTEGIMNVGPVTALEILSEFPGNDLEPLIKFSNWKRKYEVSQNKIPGSKKRESFLKFRLPEGFPSQTVFDGYMHPCADSSTTEFTWGTPELDELREYARRNFGWDAKKIDEKLLPVMKRLNERKLQPTIDSFFFKTAANQNPELFRSKRVNQALTKIAKTTEAAEENVVCLSDVDSEDESREEQLVVERGKKGSKRSVQVRKEEPTKGRSARTNATNKKRKVRGR